jgi:hypothetical protein
MRIIRLCLVILLALTTATLSAAPHKKGGSLIGSQAQTDCPYYYYCYSDGIVKECCGGACECKGRCIDDCGGPCDWDDSCPYLS